ncbi:MAG: 2-C-methyl-D-erythritol 2,4-cyclodiphosphate synthase [Oscillospiraceae bacterium]
MRIGHGYDVHKLTTGRDLILGGVKIPFERGLLGHSDADVLTHALMDALLGAAALGDIGKVFPDNDPTYKNISSLILLDRVVKMVAAAGYRLGNADCTIIAQAPKLAAFLPAMRGALADTLGVLPGQINVKATTEERLGFTGREEGIAAHAVVLLESL